MATQKEKLLFHQDNAPSHKSITTIAKLHELHIELLPHPSYSPDLTPSYYWLFAVLKRMLPGKRFGSNEEVILETEAYFEVKHKSFYKKWHRIVREALESLSKKTMLMNKAEFCCFIS